VKVSELGEFGLIDRLAEVLASENDAVAPERLLVGIGDDAAVWRTDTSATVATTDTLVGDVHFFPGQTPWRDIGWKSIAVNVSDIAAMGCLPNFALITLGLPADMETEDLEELYAGVGEAAREYGVTVTGGDIVRAPVPFVSVVLTGRGELDDDGQPVVLLRSGAKPGDAIAVTGSLGGSAAGLRVFLRGNVESEEEQELIERHQRPDARVEAGTAALGLGIRCGIDISDGLLRDLGHVCKASNVGANIQSEQLPIDAALQKAFEPGQVLALAAGGGEDYELLLVGEEAILEELEGSIDVALTIIGEITADDTHHVRLLTASGQGIELPSEGWDHLA
jgi:thiamine-monophosphate kinase